MEAHLIRLHSVVVALAGGCIDSLAVVGAVLAAVAAAALVELVAVLAVVALHPTSAFH